MKATQQHTIDELKRRILMLEGYKPAGTDTRHTFGLGAIEDAFPNGIFPLGTVHEFVCGTAEQATAAGGFISGMISSLMRNGGVCLWIGLLKNIYPVALKGFGVEPDRVVFINLNKDKDVLWAMEEALKCKGLSAVVGELKEVDFKQSRRLQLAVEKSHVTGFILRNRSKKLSTTACAARWQIHPVSSETPDGLPGVGFPRWNVELLRARNGKTGSWVAEWNHEGFNMIEQTATQWQHVMAG